MRKQYIQVSYSRDMKYKFQKLTQGNKRVEESLVQFHI